MSLSPGYLKRFHLVKKHFKRLHQCGAFESLRRPRPGAQASVHPAPLPTANRGHRDRAEQGDVNQNDLQPPRLVGSTTSIFRSVPTSATRPSALRLT